MAQAMSDGSDGSLFNDGSGGGFSLAEDGEWTGDLIEGAGAVAEGLGGAWDDLSGVTAARIQEEAQRRALEAQERMAKAQMEWLTGRSDMGLGFIRDQGGLGADAISRGAADAQGFLAGGQSNALGVVDRAGAASLGDIGSGYSLGRRDLSGGFDSARSDLSGLTALQRYGHNAAASVHRDGALSGMMDRGLYSGFESDHGYQFRQQQGEEAIGRMASARGGRLSERTLKEMSEFNQGLASQEFQNFANRRSTEAGMAAGLDDARLRADLAAQNNAMGLAGVGYNAQSGLSDLSARRGQGMAGLAVGQGSDIGRTRGQTSQSLADLFSSGASNQANIASQSGTNLGQLFAGMGTNMANTAIGTAGQQTALTQGLMGAQQHAANAAGMSAQAQSNAMQNVAGGIVSWLAS